LPQVLEAYRAIKWKNSLPTRYAGEQPTELLMDAIDIAEATLAETEAYLMQPKG
jgi:hypothetical protein